MVELDPATLRWVADEMDVLAKRTAKAEPRTHGVQMWLQSRLSTYVRWRRKLRSLATRIERRTTQEDGDG